MSATETHISSSLRCGEPATLADVLDRILDKGLVVAGDIALQLLDVEVVTIKVRLLLASVDRAQAMGIDWWRHDAFLSGKARQIQREHRQLQRRVAQLESRLGADPPPVQESSPQQGPSDA